MNDIFLGYDAVIWDYDGVIIDSEETREFGFVKCLTDYPSQQVQLLLDFHRENGGLSRFVKFRYFFEEIRNEELTEETLQQYCATFSDIMRVSLSNKELLFSTAMSQLRQNVQSNRIQFIASGSAQDELRFLCRKQGIESYFFGIYGSPMHKNEIVAMILRNYPEVKSWCLIGDSINDLRAAKLNSIDFFGVRNERLKSEGTCFMPIWV